MRRVEATMEDPEFARLRRKLLRRYQRRRVICAMLWSFIGIVLAFMWCFITRGGER
jgi:hypothetical protein